MMSLRRCRVCRGRSERLSTLYRRGCAGAERSQCLVAPACGVDSSAALPYERDGLLDRAFAHDLQQ